MLWIMCLDIPPVTMEAREHSSGKIASGHLLKVCGIILLSESLLNKDTNTEGNIY